MTQSLAQSLPLHLVLCGLMGFGLDDGRAHAASGAPDQRKSDCHRVPGTGQKCFKWREAVALLVARKNPKAWAEFVLGRAPTATERACGLSCLEAEADDRAQCARLPKTKSAFRHDLPPQTTNCYYTLHERRVQCARRCIKKLRVKELQALHRGQRVELLTAHGNFVVAEADGRLRANRKKAGPWERFEIVLDRKQGGGRGVLYYGQTVKLRTHHGKFVVAQRDGGVRADGSARDRGAKWRVDPVGSAFGPVGIAEPIRLRSAYGKYLVAEPDGSAAANRTKAGPWETFMVRAR